MQAPSPWGYLAEPGLPVLASHRSVAKANIQEFSLTMSEAKLPEDSTTRVEIAQQHPRSAAIQEEEPTNYAIGARTLLAILALCLANCCAVLTNTVRFASSI